MPAYWLEEVEIFLIDLIDILSYHLLSHCLWLVVGHIIEEFFVVDSDQFSGLAFRDLKLYFLLSVAKDFFELGTKHHRVVP